MNNKRSGGGFSFLILIGILVIWYLFAVFFSDKSSDYTYEQFKTDLENNRIVEIFVGQNKEVPTGYITVRTTANQTISFYVSDVNTVIEYLEIGNYNYSLGDVERDSVFLTIILPIMLGVVLVIFVFMIFTANAGGGGNGANSKLMNFGKSRAKM